MANVDIVKFFERNASMAEDGLAAAVERKDFHLAALNGGELFKCHLMCGLGAWRCGRDPRAALERSVVHVARAGEILLDLAPATDVFEYLPMERAALVSFLLGKEAKLSTSKLAIPDRRLDALLASALRTEVGAGAVQDAISELRANKRTALACRTYETYFAMLGQAPGTAIDALVETAERNYAQRATDGYFAGGEMTWGGGPTNAEVLDFRLAAVLKRLGYTGKTVHAWRW